VASWFGRALAHYAKVGFAGACCVAVSATAVRVWLDGGGSVRVRESDKVDASAAAGGMGVGSGAATRRVAKSLAEEASPGPLPGDLVNPHAAELLAQKRAQGDYWRKIRTLQAMAESSTGEERMEACDELRRMRVQGVRLSREYSVAKSNYTAWVQTESSP